MSAGGWDLLASLAGGVGLFLLGMTMMTDGLRLAAGPALERILASATRTRWHGLGSGVLVTSLVQSSSAVTVATIGFINAGLLALGPALWVLFGANVGTTMTGWIVALVGLKFKVESLALPLVGLGVLLHLSGAGQRRGAIGGAVTGFGLLFLGIGLLQSSFTGLAAQVTLPQGSGAGGVLAQMAVGVVMTVLMQSSSASMAIALTAAQGGLLSPEGAAAVVIGANIGTTATAMLAAIGATPNAKRAAAAHVVFNAFTGVVALALLPWLLTAMDQARTWLGLPADPATSLALFHTTFNVMGVALMWPLALPLTAWLQQRFRVSEHDEARPRHLDDTLLGVPALALKALNLEVARVGHAANRLARAVLTGADRPTLARDQAVVDRLAAESQAFVERMGRASMTQATSEGLAQVLRLLRYHESVAELALQAAPLHPLAPAHAPSQGHGHGHPGAAHVPAVELVALQADFLRQADHRLARTDPLQTPDADSLAFSSADAPASASGSIPGQATPGDPVVGERPLTSEGLSASEPLLLHTAYEALKTGLLAAGARGQLRLGDMEDLLRRYSALRHASDQAAKAWQRRLVLPPGVPQPGQATPLH